VVPDIFKDLFTLEDDGAMLLKTSGTTHLMTFSHPRRPEPSYCPHYYN